MEGNADPSVKITLVGKTGVGKSASANTILGVEDLFHSEISSCSVTTTCQEEQRHVAENWTVTVIDTPDFFYGTQGENLSSEIEKSVLSGVHVFLYVISLTSFTVQEVDYVSQYLNSFGEEVMGYTIILFTHGDQLENKTIEEMIEQNDSLQNLLSRCSGRYHVLNNESTNRDQVMELLQKIDRMMLENGNIIYTREMLPETKRQLERSREEERGKRKRQEDLEKARRETEEQVRKEMEGVRRRLKDEDRQIEDISDTEEQKTPKWIRFGENAFSQLKRKPFLAIGVFFIVAMGGFNVQTTLEDSRKLKVFTQGCLMAAFPMLLGIAPGVLVRMTVMSASTYQTHLKCFGVLCGFTAGTLASYFMDTWVVTNIARTGVFGACGAMIMMPVGQRYKVA